MNPKRKIAQIERLAKAIGYIAGDFERFGGLFLEALLEVPLDHKGTNLLGYPVASVVDTLSDDGRIVAEYSDEAGYFDNPMRKAEGDLQKALQKKPDAQKIFLLSGKPKRPQVADAFEDAVRKWPGMVGKSLHLWGAEKIAEKLVEDLVFNDSVVRRLAPYLPELQRIRDEEAASRLAPTPDRSRLRRPNVEEALSRHFAGGPVVVLTGIGGLGKSENAAAYAADNEDDFDLVIWLEAGEIHRVEELQALPLVRSGETRNITALLQTHSCLLVIDDVDVGIDPNDLAPLCGSRSRIILTRRTGIAGAYEVPFLNADEARELMERNGAPCSQDAFGVIWSTVGGHPLSLALIGTAVEQGADWSDIILDCQAVGEMEDRGQRLADRLLGRLRPTLERELSVFAWADQSDCSQDFLAHCVQPLGLRKLRRHGLTAPDRSGVVRLHDVVFSALVGDRWCSDERDAELNAALESYIIQAASETGLQLWAIGRILRRKLENLVESGARQPAFRYALLSVWDPSEVRPELVGDPKRDADELIGQPPGPLAVMAVIEAVEQLFLFEKADGDDVAKTRLRSRLPVFDTLCSLPGLSDLEKAEIQHHRGKAYKRLGEPSTAAKLFEDVLAGPTPLNESRLQLIDVYRVNPKTVDRAIELVDEVLGEQIREKNVSFSVLLGVIERLPWGGGVWREELIKRHSAIIEQTIVEAAEAGTHQAAQSFAALGRYLSTENPALFRRIWERLPKPPVTSLQIDSERFGWGEVFFEASRVYSDKSAQLQAAALVFYEAEVKPQGFHLQRRAELLIEMDRASEAEALLRARDDLDRSVWLQRLVARARLAQGDARDALEWIDRALGRLTAEQFRSEFLELRYDIRSTLGDDDARADLRKARDASQKSAESARLDDRLTKASQSQV